MNKSSAVKNISFIAITSALICACSLVTVPAPVPFTLQTFGVFFALKLLGGRNGFISILLYILLGIVGLPVFSSFGSGIGVLLGPTGGYIFGFLLIALVYWIASLFFKRNLLKIIALLVGLLISYIFGAVWFTMISFESGDNISFLQVLVTCVLPFVIPDFIKLFAASYISNKVKILLIKNRAF